MLVAIVGVVVSATGCGDDAAASSGRTLDDPWLPGNSQFDESCDSCEEFADIRFPHAGDVVIKSAAQLDDPLAQWGECVSSFFVCWEQDNPVPGCVASSQCPAPCKAEFRREVVGAADEEEEIYAFNRVFVDDDAPCRPPAVEPQEVSP